VFEDIFGYRIKRTPRKGTVGLLRLTKALSEPDRTELLAYVGQLEQAEDGLALAIEQLILGRIVPPGETKNPPDAK
jgi:hypothetical protein